MDIGLLRAFLSLGETRSFSVSARQMGLSQSSLSKKIRRLEDVIGGSLFTRNTHTTSLTPLGSHMLDDARDLVEQSARVLERGRGLARGKVGRLRIGFTFSAIPLVSKILPGFEEEEAGCGITLEDMSSSEQETALLARHIDIGFMREPWRPGLSFTHLTVDELVFVAPIGKMGRRTNAELDTGGLPLIRFKQSFSHGVHDRTETILSAFGLEGAETQWFNEAISALQIVSAGLACAIVHRSCLDGLPRLDDLVTVQTIPHPAARWNVGIAIATGTTDPARERFVAFCRNRLAVQTE